MSNRLPILAASVKDLHNEVVGHVTAAAEKALAIGAALAEAKALCEHGTWANWLAGSGIAERSAQRYMKLHRAGCKSSMVADTGFASAERLASLGLRLWPSEGRGIEIAGTDGDGASCYALIVPDGAGHVTYAAAFLFPSAAQDF